MHPRFVAFGALALSLAAVSVARPVVAQTPAPTPTPINLPTLPPDSKIAPYVQMGVDLIKGVINAQVQANANQASGRVQSFRPFELSVQTGRNSYRQVHLHHGTVINPTGESLAPGQRVSVVGIAQPDGSLNADTITIDH
jgi:hypothetical protein